MEYNKKKLIKACSTHTTGMKEYRVIELEKLGAEAPYFYKLNEITFQGDQTDALSTSEIGMAFSDEPNIPFELISTLKEKVDLLRRLGFEIEEPVSESDDNTPSIYWLLELPSSLTASVSSVSQTIVDGFKHAANTLGFDSTNESLMSISNYSVLVDQDSSMLNDSIDLTKISGAGQIDASHGHIPVIVMFYIAYYIEMNHGSAGKNVLQFTLGNEGVVAYDGKFDSLSEVIEHFSFNKASVREISDKLGLTHKAIDIKSEISDAVEDFFF